MNTPASRRQFLGQGMAAFGLLSVGAPAAWAKGLPPVPPNLNAKTGMLNLVAPANLGPLQPPDANGLRLPAGFSSRVVARSSQAVGTTGYVWHGAPDGGGTVPTVGGGWIYVSNSELSSAQGGASAISFAADGNIVSAYRICSGSSRNCAGGITPWGTFLTCEEIDLGRVIECDPRGVNPPVVRNALGWFDHEAVACDPSSGYLYLTEDKADGRFYRFRPSISGNLSAGTLEVARLSGTGPLFSVQWLVIKTPNPSASQTRTRHQARKSTAFNGGEGCWFHGGMVYITTKGDNRVWAMDVQRSTMQVIYDDNTAPAPVLTGVDNVTVSATGRVLVAEDGGNMQVCVLGTEGSAAPLLQVDGHDSSEVTGIAFSPDGSRLYFSSQRGSTGSSSAGVTFEVSGPFLSM